MKAYKIDLSGFTGKVREVVSEAVQKKAALLEYDKTGTFCDFDKPYLFVTEEVGCSWDDSTDYYFTSKYTAITAADFLALETAKEPEFKATQKVLIRTSNEKRWTFDFFSHVSQDENDIYICVGGAWPQCIPYEGNEHLIGTTDSPK